MLKSTLMNKILFFGAEIESTVSLGCSLVGGPSSAIQPVILLVEPRRLDVFAFLKLIPLTPFPVRACPIASVTISPGERLFVIIPLAM